VQGSLLTTYKMRLCRESIALDERHVVLTPATLCHLCSKRVGRAPAVATPDACVVHESCWRRARPDAAAALDGVQAWAPARQPA
jgi:Vacuolar sorting protein 39 domain 2